MRNIKSLISVNKFKKYIKFLIIFIIFNHCNAFGVGNALAERISPAPKPTSQPARLASTNITAAVVEHANTLNKIIISQSSGFINSRPVAVSSRRTSTAVGSAPSSPAATGIVYNGNSYTTFGNVTNDKRPVIYSGLYADINQANEDNAVVTDPALYSSVWAEFKKILG